MSVTPPNCGETIETRALIGGQFVDSTTTFTVVNPATDEPIADVADITTDQALEALGHAVDAMPAWAATSQRTKATVLRDIFDALLTHQDALATVMTWEMGKPLAEARGEITYGAEYFRWFSEQAAHLPGYLGAAPGGSGRIGITRTPVGPVLAITPWNFPLAMATRKIAPALAAGCPILVKPAHETPLTMIYAGQIIRDVLKAHGAPTALVQILTTEDAPTLSAALMSDPRLRKVTFTGSTNVGKILVKQSAENLLRTSMELGGNAPFVIAEDADMDVVIPAALAAKMRNGGQACIAANRFLVHSSLHDEFVDRLSQAMDEFVMGDGLDEATTLGPMITAKQADRITALVADAVDKGATVTTTSTAPDSPGYFVAPTVLTNLHPDSAILSEEIFGPVAPVISFDSLEDAVRQANDTPFGLATYGFSSSVAGLNYLRDNLQAGMVGLNRGAISDPAAPFGGIKQSGFGREGGVEGIEEYLDVRYIADN